MHLQMMVIDDDPIFRLIAGALLKQAGIMHPLFTCSDGHEALSELGREITEEKKFLLFLDINMPVLDGWVVLDMLKQFPYPENIFVIIVTSSVNKADRERALAYDQVFQYLIKPLKLEDLLHLRSIKPLEPFFENGEV